MSRSFSAALITSTLIACGGGGGGGGGTNPVTPPVPTAVQIMVDVTRTISEPDQSTGIDWFVSVTNNGVGVSNAVVTIDGKVLPFVGGFSTSDYRLSYFTSPVRTYGTATYLVGQDYTVTVQFGGATYSDTMRVPGGVSIDSTGSSVAWVQGGSYASILVTHLFGATTYTSAVLGPPSLLTSPQVIPPSAYPSPDTYQLTAVVQNERRPPGAYPGAGYFGSLVGPTTHFVIQDARIKRVTK